MQHAFPPNPVVVAGSMEWDMPLPGALRPKPAGDFALEQSQPDAARQETYEVKKSDAIIKIQRKFEMSAWQLKRLNELMGEVRADAGGTLLADQMRALRRP